MIVSLSGRMAQAKGKQAAREDQANTPSDSLSKRDKLKTIFNQNNGLI